MTAERIFGLLTFAVVFALALVPVHDTDAWMHLHIGRLVWEHGGPPGTVSYIYTAEDRPFVYTSWLFGWLCYAAFESFSYAGVVLLRAAVVGLAFLILYKDIVARHGSAVLAFVLVVLSAVFIRDRFVIRPDIFMFVFLVLSIYITNLYIKENSRLIYALPFIHLVWANVHSSVLLYLAPYLAVLGVGVGARLLARAGVPCAQTPGVRKLAVLAGLLVLSTVLVGLNPNGYDQFAWGTSILATEYYREQILEFLSPLATKDPRPFILTGLVVGLFAVQVAARLSRGWTAARLDAPTLVGWVLVWPFVVMTWQAVRFFYPLVVVAAPVLAGCFADAAKLLPKLGAPRGRGWITAALLSVVVLGVGADLAVRGPYPNGRFGLGPDLARTPDHALGFMDAQGISGRMLNTYHFGAYIAWRDGAKRPVFADPSGNVDVALLEKLSVVEGSLRGIDELYDEYGFESVLFRYPDTADLVLRESLKQAVRSSPWALVYWDDVALLYVRRDGPYRAIADRYSYEYAVPVGGFDSLRPDIDAGRFEAVVEELRRAVEWSDSALAHLLLGQSLAYRGRLDEGAGHLEAAAARNYVAVRHPYHAWMGFIRHRQTRLAEAVEHYEAAVRLVRDPRTMENLASIHRDMGDDARAIDLLERVLQEDAENVSVIAKLVDLYARKGETRKSRQYGERLARLQAAAPARQSRQTAKRNFELGMAAYARGDHDEALRYLNAALQAHPRSPSLLSNLGFVWFDKGDYRKALSLHEQSIAADDRHANGHYGAAQAYKALGDTDKAKQHWARYVELVPNGRFARKARQELRGAD